MSNHFYLTPAKVLVLHTEIPLVCPLVLLHRKSIVHYAETTVSKSNLGLPNLNLIALSLHYKAPMTI